MKRLVIAAAALVALTSVASADYRRHRHYAAPHYHKQYHKPHYRHQNWVAPLVGGLVLGGALYGMHQYYQAQPYCSTALVGYDYWGRPVYQRVCR
jgi:hypothetical protein